MVTGKRRGLADAGDLGGDRPDLFLDLNDECDADYSPPSGVPG
jgi:hypothetical protein